MSERGQFGPVACGTTRANTVWAFGFVAEQNADAFKCGCPAALARQHNVQPIFCAAEQNKAIPHGSFLPMIQACSCQDVMEATIDREGNTKRISSNAAFATTAEHHTKS
tara:strand:+ start:9468 stop:9794 length:327 start_codon:yes stop_codon:yes gene_type:complete